MMTELHAPNIISYLVNRVQCPMDTNTGKNNTEFKSSIIFFNTPQIIFKLNNHLFPHQRLEEWEKQL